MRVGSLKMKMQGVLLPGQRQRGIQRIRCARTRPRPGADQDEGLVHLRQRHPRHLPRAPGPRARKATRASLPGHEPCGQIVKVGPGCKRFKEGDRVILYHITGCGVCNDCREGYMISCTSEHRAAYGWQRDGGHADYLPGRGEHLRGAARHAQLRRRRAGGLRLRHRLRGAQPRAASPARTAC